MEKIKRPALVYNYIYRIYSLIVFLIVTCINGEISPLYGQTEVSPAKRTALQSTFLAELGKYDRNTISGYLAYTDLTYGHEWCAAFVSWCFGKIGYTEPRTPWSPALFPNKRTVWQQGKNTVPIKVQTGMVWGIHIQTKGRIGHVGFVDAIDNGIITTVEGNTKPPDNRKSNGVYRKRRALRTIKAIAEWL